MLYCINKFYIKNLTWRILIIYVNRYQLSLNTRCAYRKNHEIPEKGHEPRPKHAEAIINKKKPYAVS